jgi:transcriptional regulator with XRE-family HTH domain
VRYQAQNAQGCAIVKKYSEIGRRLKGLRGGVPQRVYAKRMGISCRAYQNYESGERVPPATILDKIAQKEFATVDWILTGRLRSLGEKLLTEKIEVSLLQKNVDRLEKDLIESLREKKIPIPKDIGGFANTLMYLREQGKSLEFLSFLTQEKTSLLSVMRNQVERIFLEGNREKLKAMRSFLKALDPNKKG